MRPDDMKRIARATSAGFAMPITAQFEDESMDWNREDTPGSSPQPDGDWARRMLEDLRNDEDIFQQGQDVGEDNIVPTDEQRSQIGDLEKMFPGAMDMSTEDPDEDQLGEMFPSTNEDVHQYPDINMRDSIERGREMTPDYPETEDDPQVQDFIEGGRRLDDQKRGMHEKEMLRQRTREDMGDDADMFRDLASDSSRLLRLAAHLDSLGLHQVADDLDTAAEIEIEDLLESIACSNQDEKEASKDKKPWHGGWPWASKGKKKGKPCKATVRTAQAQLAEVGLDEDDIDLSPEDDQSQIVSFDPERGNMIVRDPKGIFKLYTITGTSENGKPRFELGQIIDSPNDEVEHFSEKLMGPPTIDLGNARHPSRRTDDYVSQLMGGNPNIQQAYA